MRSRRSPRLRLIASSLMLLAAVAFAVQGVAVAISQAAAAVGFFPEPAVALSGPVHYHGDLARQVHIQGSGQSDAGHVHGPSDVDHHHADGEASILLWSLGCTSVIIPIGAACSAALESAGVVRPPTYDLLKGAEPDGLIRPPSTPSIA